jgi:hypothetical protein
MVFVVVRLLTAVYGNFMLWKTNGWANHPIERRRVDQRDAADKRRVS